MLNTIVYIIVFGLIAGSLVFVGELTLPQGIGETGIDLDYVPILALALGIFVGAVSSQIYDRYLKQKRVRALTADFLVGALASTILTAFLFKGISEIKSVATVFTFAFQNGFFFTTVIEKIGAKNAK